MRTSKIGLIISREYSSRVKKRSFILLTILGPLLMVGFIFTALYLGQQDEDEVRILIHDDTFTITQFIKNNSNNLNKLVVYDTSGLKTYDDAMDDFKKSDHYDLLVYLPENIVETKNSTGIIQYKKPPTAKSLTFITNTINKAIEKSTLHFYNIPLEDYDRFKSDVQFRTIDIATSEENNNLAKSGVGLFFGVIIYLFIFMYGIQVMKAVIEEKTNRIVEVLVSSIKPFQLMMGKIIGIMLVGLTQFSIWVLLIAVSLTALSIIAFPDMLDAANQAELMQNNVGGEVAMENDFADLVFRQINWSLMIGLFIFYFIGGYLLYGSLMAAIGAAVDSETDTQQFMIPVSMPLFFAYIIAINITGNPNGSTAFWCSEIPFTSPIVMLVRVAIGGEGMIWQVLLSMSLLIVTFIFTTWIAAKIYRVGILMYGKKPSYKELLKWIRFKD